MASQTILSTRRPSVWRIPDTAFWSFFCLGERHAGHPHPAGDFCSEAEALAFWPLCRRCTHDANRQVEMQNDMIAHLVADGLDVYA